MSDSEHQTPPEAPATDYAYGEGDAATPATLSKWPKVFGVISMIYALGGLLCSMFLTTLPWITEWGTRLGGMTLEFPPMIKLVTVTTGLLNFTLGLVLFFGAINLLRRRRSGVALHKFWAMGRIVLILVGVVVTVVTTPQQIDFQREAIEYQNDQMRQAGRDDLIQDFSDDELWTRLMMQTAIFSVIVAIYPLVVGFKMSGRKVADEIEDWDELMDV